MSVKVWGTYMLNGVTVTAPDEEAWTPIVSGVAVSGHQKRSPYWMLEWRKQVVAPCSLEWKEYDNTTLTTLTTRPNDEDGLDAFVTYIDVILQSVTLRQRRGVGTEMVAQFLVNTELTL